MNRVLTDAEIATYDRDGYLILEDAVTADQLRRLRDQWDAWVEDSRAHAGDFGDYQDGRARFDLESGHSSDAPKLRRVNSPVEISDIYMEIAKSSRMADAVVDLIGPDVKFHHSKINSKPPRSGTEVKWHQDFPYTPHTNDDVVTTLLMVDAATEANGALRVAPGSHKEPLKSIWHGGVFTGAVDEETRLDWEARAITCEASAGAVCLMHTRVGHGSVPNHSDGWRTVAINVYSADDAVPLTRNPLPSAYEGMLIAGKRTGRIRSIGFGIEIPQYPTTTSFFEQQEAVGQS